VPVRRAEAKELAQCCAMAYTSVLKRAIQTLGEKFGEAQVKSGGGVTISARRS
jgi:hypothetical protein